MSFVYLDHAASSPLCGEALRAERDYESSEIAGVNPNSLHTLGRRAARELDASRRVLASCLGAAFRPADIVLTSGGTESNNIALHGMAAGARERDRRRSRVLVSAIEHDSILDVLPSLRDAGFEAETIPVGSDGKVSLDALHDGLDERVALVSVMSANNETGVVQPLAEVARLSHGVGALVHTDAVQAFGRIPLELRDVDGVSVAAHKIGGPVGIGALALRGRCPFRPQSFGGGQEQGRRAGTQDVRGALAFAAAARACTGELDERRAVVSARSRRLYERICAQGSHILATAGCEVGDDRLPGLVSILVEGLDSESLILQLDQRGFEVSAGSACSSGSLDPSHVLSAMGIPRSLALGSLRVSFDERTTDGELDAFAGALLETVSLLRRR